MRIDGNIQLQQLNQANVLDILGRLNVGDVIKAKVLEMTSGELMLRLFDGTVFKAAVTADIDTKPGDMLELSVSGKNDGTITLETVKKNIKSESSQNEIKKLLISMDLPTGPDNMILAGEFKEAGVKIVPEVFKKAAELINKFNGITPEKAVFLASKDIMPEEGRIENIIKFAEGRLKLGKQLDELQTILSSLSDALQTESGKNNTFTDPAAKTQIHGGSTLNKAVSSPIQQQAAGWVTQPTLQIVPSAVGSQDVDGVVQLKANNSGNGAVQQGANGASGSNKENAAGSSVGNMAGSTVGNLERSAVGSTAGSAVENSGAEDAALAGRKSSAAEAQEVLSVKTQQNLTGKDKALLIEKATPLDSEFGNKLLKSEAADLKKLNDDFKTLFVRTDSDNLKSELEIKRLYKDIADKLDMIKSTVVNSGLPGLDDITARISNIDDGMKLLSQLNSSTSYYQIPLNISGFNTTGELYVMRREDKRRRIDPRDVTMFISLDTQNIGRIESVIDIKGKTVSMNMRAEKQQVIDFMKENFKSLYNGLAEKGYRLADIKYRLLEDPATPLNMERIVKKAAGGGKTTVDMRI